MIIHTSDSLQTLSQNKTKSKLWIFKTCQKFKYNFARNFTYDIPSEVAWWNIPTQDIIEKLCYQCMTLIFLAIPLINLNSKSHGGNGGMLWWCHQMVTFSVLLSLCVGIPWSLVNFLHKGQWRRALMFSLISTWINCCVNNCEAGDLRCHHAHYDAIVMWKYIGNCGKSFDL